MKKVSAIILVLATLILFTCSCGKVNDDLSGSVFTEDGVGKYLTGCYLKVDGIDGDCGNAKHDRWIDVIDFDFGVERDPATRVTTFEPFVIVHKVDSASSRFQKYCSLGMQINSVVFEKTATISGKETVTLKITLPEAVVSSAQITCDANGNMVETVKFAYTKATIAYTPINADGSAGTTVTDTIDIRG